MLLVPIFETLRGLGLLNTTAALVLPYIVLNLPVCTLVPVSFFQRTPKDLENAWDEFLLALSLNSSASMLDLCMFAENSIDSEHITVVGDTGKLESLLPALTLRYGKREDWGTRKVWGEASGSGKGVSVRRVWDTNIKYAGQHFGASFIEHRQFANAVRNGTPPEVTLEDGLRSVATGLAAHRNIDTGRAVALSEVLPAG
jgi:myo-inositol 2-dehydrogenase / D-chiro-inositol 1-dehydrogenase